MTGPEKPLTGLDKQPFDKALTDELVRTIRTELREEFREQTKKQRRKATLYAASGATALYAGAAIALAAGLALDLALPDWAAALIVAALLGVAALLLRNAARPRAGRPTLTGTRTRGKHTGRPGLSPDGLTAPGAPQGGPSAPAAPPMPPTAPTVPRETPGGGDGERGER
ncbi:phage holin family protein [Streptomyces sp. 135]|uniref:phage holin family protein n=1 Tax=Streptomyces sp. 135 TaxID=2838850 RepID=UPI001CC18030|nr:phage holin family protein [Streptomyces sp. 135]